MHDHRVQAVMHIAHAAGAGAALLSSPATIRWIGAERARHVLVADGDAVLIASDAASAPRGTDVERFDAGHGDGLADALARALARAGLGTADPVAVEPTQLPVRLARLLGAELCRDIGGALAGARARKDVDEIAAIARAAELAATAQRTLREQLAPGLSELELWSAARAAATAAAGDDDIEAQADLMAGTRSSLIGVAPGRSVVAAGDPVLFSLTLRRDGWWATSSATHVCGSGTGTAPSAQLRRRHAYVRRALERGLRAARPGATTGEVDRAMRAELALAGLDCPHDTGHGIGRAARELPRLTPGGTTPLEAGMVLALAPGAYGGGFGMRLGLAAVVAHDGAQPLAPHPMELG
jgi:Xaa-Pro aminopeptidase